MKQNAEIRDVLHAGSFLIDPAKSPAPSDLQAVLLSRLAQYHEALGQNAAEERVLTHLTLQQTQQETALSALYVVEYVQKSLQMDDGSVASTSQSQNEPEGGAPVIGTRDLAELRTLISIAFRWGILPLLALVQAAWPDKPAPAALFGPRIIDLTTTSEDYNLLTSMVTRMLSLLLPRGPHSQLPQTLITTTLLNRHLTDLFKPCIALGWLPKALSSNAMPVVDEIRPSIMRLLEILPPSQTISVLGAVISASPAPATHARKACASLLSRQLLRPEGVRGLCAAVFGEDEESGDSISLEKLQHVSRVLCAIPAGMKPKDYFLAILPRILDLLSDSAPLAFRRAAAFTLSRMLASESGYVHQALVSSILIPAMHDPFLYLTQTEVEGSHFTVSGTRSPTAALSTLMQLILHTDPSPTLISALLSPIMPELYTLSAAMEHIKTADPVLKESIRGLLATWGRVVISSECYDKLFLVLEGSGGDWKVDVSGEIQRIEKNKETGLNFLTPADLRRSEETGELDFNSNLLNLRPDPVHFVGFLKAADRTDVSSDLFVKLLEDYREARVDGDANPMRTMLYLQLIIQMQSQLAEGQGSSNILSKPEHILSFVKHTLSTSVLHETEDSHQKPQPDVGIGALRIVPEDNELSEDGDSDDEDLGAPDASSSDELVDTAINLLLAILEANEELSARIAPILNDIFTLLEPLANVPGTTQTLAREARMVMTARLASMSTKGSAKTHSKHSGEMKAQETYQKAIKLLQDPILPVRAHGLLLLRQLVNPKLANLQGATYVDPALIPSIIAIFLQAIQDDDSYMFLNAVQGFAAMVDTFGKDVLKTLITEYSRSLDGLSGSDLTQADVDKRTRIGEALGQVIKRFGSALGIYADILIPPLMHVFRAHHVPITLRTSALSLLSECATTDPLVFTGYASDLSDAMIDLLQVERVVERPEAEADKGKGSKTDKEPTSSDSKLPALRRGALHFYAQIIRASTAQVYESGYSSQTYSTAHIRRAKTTLTYVAATDHDVVVRVMANEAAEGLTQLSEALAGL